MSHLGPHGVFSLVFQRCLKCTSAAPILREPVCRLSSGIVQVHKVHARCENGRDMSFGQQIKNNLQFPVFVCQNFSLMSKCLLNRTNFIIIRKVCSEKMDFFYTFAIERQTPFPALMALISIFHF